MKQILLIIQIVLSVLLIILVLLQPKGVGLGRSWGGGGEFYKSRRGVEKIIFRFTTILAFLFLVSSVIAVVTP